MDAGFQDRWIKPLSHPSDMFDFNNVGRTPGLKLTAGTFSIEKQPKPSRNSTASAGQAVSDVVFAGAASAFPAQPCQIFSVSLPMKSFSLPALPFEMFQ
jgi:hypothetical protein